MEPKEHCENDNGELEGFIDILISEKDVDELEEALQLQDDITDFAIWIGGVNAHNVVH